MLNRWESESVDIPAVEMARVLLQVPTITTTGEQYVVKVPIVVDLEELSVLTSVLTQNGYHYVVQPIEAVVD